MSRTTPAPSPVRVVAEVVAFSAAVGAVVGFLWLKLSPEVTVEIRADGAALYIEQARKLFDREAMFALLAAGAAVLLAVTSTARHRRRPVTVLLALVAGGCLASLVAFGLGRLLGPGSVDPSSAGPVGSIVPVPLELDAWGVLLVWPIVAAVVVAVMTVFRDDRTPWGRGANGTVSADGQVLNPIGRSSPSSPR